jgi:hypothetical protein
MDFRIPLKTTLLFPARRPTKATQNDLTQFRFELMYKLRGADLGGGARLEMDAGSRDRHRKVEPADENPVAAGRKRALSAKIRRR